MPSLKDIRRRITSVEKTKQITSAMRMVAAAKLRRAQEAIEAARPYAERMRETLVEVAGSQPGLEQPLMVARESVRKAEFLVITSDRGLCGAFNANVIKSAETEILAREPDLDEVSLALFGRKAVEFFRHRRGKQIDKSLSGASRIVYEHAVQVAEYAAERYVSGAVDEIVLVVSEFVSTMTQRPRCLRLLPMAPEPTDGSQERLPYEIEPDAATLLNVLAPTALEVEIYRALLENQAGEHAARMTAMESATRNSEEMIESLTLQYNRARQAAITKELVEIVSGAEAL